MAEKGRGFSKHCLYKELKGAGGGIGLRPSIRHFALQLTTIVCIIESKCRILLSWFYNRIQNQDSIIVVIIESKMQDSIIVVL